MAWYKGDQAISQSIICSFSSFPLRNRSKRPMSQGLNIRKDAELDLLSLGALVHRLDTGIIPFRKATECKIDVSGGEFNVAANLSDCFGLKTGDRKSTRLNS